jgi:nucleotide-binding universal stress UspA family protein
MTTILCPTRGGKESHPNQDYAINLARVRDADLLFMYVSNIQLISRSGPPIVVDIEEELDELGDFLLSMAQERAEKSGVLAKATVRRGVFSEVLKEVIVEKKINTVILGSASEGTGLVSYEHLQELSAELSKEMGVEFIVVQGGKVVFHTEA